MFRTEVYHCWGSRSRLRYRSTAHTTALGEERVGVTDCGQSLGDCIFLDTGMYVPGTLPLSNKSGRLLAFFCLGGTVSTMAL